METLRKAQAHMAKWSSGAPSYRSQRKERGSMPSEWWVLKRILAVTLSLLGDKWEGGECINLGPVQKVSYEAGERSSFRWPGQQSELAWDLTMNIKENAKRAKESWFSASQASWCFLAKHYQSCKSELGALPFKSLETEFIALIRFWKFLRSPVFHLKYLCQFSSLVPHIFLFIPFLNM